MTTRLIREITDKVEMQHPWFDSPDYVNRQEGDRADRESLIETTIRLYKQMELEEENEE